MSPIDIIACVVCGGYCALYGYGLIRGETPVWAGFINPFGF